MSVGHILLVIALTILSYVVTIKVTKDKTLSFIVAVVVLFFGALAGGLVN